MEKKIGKMRTGSMLFGILLAIGLVFGQTAAWAGVTVVYAGADITIPSTSVDTTTVRGTAVLSGNSTLQYRWMKGVDKLLNWSDVVDGTCPLALVLLHAGSYQRRGSGVDASER